jgi:hypothetical protein
MLKSLLACLFASLVAAPTLPPGVPLVGMRKSQVESMLGVPLSWYGFHVGQLSNVGLTCEVCEHDGVTVEYSYGTVVKVKFTR